MKFTIIMLILAAYQFVTAAETKAVVWENCDNINRKTWGQTAWRPKSFVSTEVGKLSADTTEKAEGKGSIRFEITYEDVVEKMKKMPTLDRICVNYLHGSDFSKNTAYEFQIKCESAQHPEIWVAMGYTKWNKILNRNEVTNGWKKIKIPSVGLFPKPCPATVFRVFALPKEFKEGDKIDLYIDDMKLYR